MLFTDFKFIFLFLPVSLFVFYRFKTKNNSYYSIVIASYIFYGLWNYKFLSLLIISTIVDYFAGFIISRNPDSEKIKKAALVFSIGCNLCILGFFKYYIFFSSELHVLLANLGFNVAMPHLNVILPVGISFYTFQSMSYTLDVYRGDVKPTRNFLKFASYVSLFPQLVAGPIVRYKEIDQQLDCVGDSFSISNLRLGFRLFIIGLAKKAIIADYLAGQINPMFENYTQLGMVATWMAVIGYTFQIYFDFSGYSDMAIGIGRMLGFKLPFNFNSPYKSKNIAEFWRRWHMTLSNWLRDYLYIALGGNRYGTRKTAINILIVFILCGLWHGAAWTFVVWGIFHGVLVAVYFLGRRFWDNRPVIFQRSICFLFIALGWVIFRSDSLNMAYIILKQLFAVSSFSFSEVTSSYKYLTIVNLVLLVIVNCTNNTNSFTVKLEKKHAVILAFLFFLGLIAINSFSTEFLYYQF